MKKTLLVLAVVLVLGAGGYMLLNSQKAASPIENAMPALGTSGVEEVVVEGGTGPSGDSEKAAQGEMMAGKSEAKEFTLDTTEFAFDVKEITVKKGDTVKLTLTNSGKMPHDWVVDELSAKTKQITNGQTDTITFVADKAGTFEYYCSVGKHRSMGMVGKLIVTE